MANVREKYKKEFEDRARALVSQMTLEEKAAKERAENPTTEDLLKQILQEMRSKA